MPEWNESKRHAISWGIIWIFFPLFVSLILCFSHFYLFIFNFTQDFCFSHVKSTYSRRKHIYRKEIAFRWFSFFIVQELRVKKRGKMKSKSESDITWKRIVLGNAHFSSFISPRKSYEYSIHQVVLRIFQNYNFSFARWISYPLFGK